MNIVISVILFFFLFFKNQAYSNDLLKFKYILCDCLSNAEYNFGLEKRGKSFILHKLIDENIKTKKVKFDKNTYNLNLKKNNLFSDDLYVNFSNKYFYRKRDNKFLGGCFVVKNKKILHCKLKSYRNVFYNKLPLSCN